MRRGRRSKSKTRNLRAMLTYLYVSLQNTLKTQTKVHLKNSSKIIDEAAVSILGKSPTQTPDETV